MLKTRLHDVRDPVSVGYVQYRISRNDRLGSDCPYLYRAKTAA